jgi:S1-C subfamily serine protease
MRTTLITTFLAALAVLAAGCGDETPKSQAERRAAADAQRAVVLVEGVYGDRRTSATGVIFEAKQGLALTANHPIEGAPAILVTMPDGTLMKGRLVARAQCHDLAVLELRPRPRGVTPLPFGDPDAVGVGDPVTTLSYQLKAAETDAPALSSVRGTITAVNVRETFTPLPPMDPLLAHQSPLGPSGSGSPLVDARGRMIGLNTLVAHPRDGGLPGVEYALSANYIRERLRQLKPGKAGALGGWRDEHDACHAALHRLIAAGHSGGGATGHGGSKPGTGSGAAGGHGG